MKNWTPKPVSIALAQFAMSESPAKNLDLALEYVREAANSGADIVCLPELFRSPYFCIDEHTAHDYSEELPGEVAPALQAVAKEYRIAIVGGSVYERIAGKGAFNTSVVVNKDGNLIGSYRKVHIPHDPAFFERNYFAEGDQGFKVFDLTFAKVAVLICYDQWFPEAARSVALLGADIVFYPTAIGTVEELGQPEGNWQHAWETVMKGHAVANNFVVAAVNRVGIEGNSTFWGGSFVCDAFGRELAKGSTNAELVLATIDLAHSKITRDGWRFFESRRPALYTEITKSRT